MIYREKKFILIIAKRVEKKNRFLKGKSLEAAKEEKE